LQCESPVAPAARLAHAKSQSTGFTKAALAERLVALSKPAELTKLSWNTVWGIGLAEGQAIVTIANIFRACGRNELDPYSCSRRWSEMGRCGAADSLEVFRSWPRVRVIQESRPVVVRLSKRTSNTPAMLRLITSPDPHTSSIAAFSPRMANDENRAGGTGGPATSVITKVKPKTKRPNLYRVLILNDDYTPMEFVVHVLEKFFQKDVEAATKIMLHVHHHGIGECGIFTYEIAETKVTQVMDFARKHQHPLQCVMEKK
jgi:ATP-dependent Clp protease adaptor protein ClpS